MSKKFAFVCALLLCLAALGCGKKDNPYSAFDPEGAIVNKYIGMNVQQLQKANGLLRYDGSKPYVTYDKSIGVNAKFSCQITDGLVESVGYIYTPGSADLVAETLCGCIMRSGPCSGTRFPKARNLPDISTWRRYSICTRQKMKSMPFGKSRKDMRYIFSLR
jgi:hypothetical protein